MITEDYLMRMLLAFFQALMEAQSRTLNNKDYVGSAELLENLVGEASNLGPEMFLSLAPESAASLLQTTGCDPQVTEFMARSLMQAAEYREKSGDEATSQLRRDQAKAIAAAYGHDLSVSMEEWMHEHDFSE